jgi:hypothetical protein
MLAQALDVKLDRLVNQDFDLATRGRGSSKAG